jgi:signal transduction histidine kinase
VRIVFRPELIFLTAVFIISPVFASAQQKEQYIELLAQAATAAEYHKHLGDMIDTFHEGKLQFVDGDVRTIVSNAQSKTFADAILPEVYGWAGSMYGDGRMKEAMLYFMESANLYARQGKRAAESLCYFQIALVQHKAENYNEAKEFYQRALKGPLDSLNHRTVINCYNGLALIEREEQEYDLSEESFRKAYSMAVIKHDTAWIAILLGNIGSIHLREGNYDSALLYYQRNLALIRKTTEFENEIETYAHLSRVYLGKENLNLAFTYLDSAMWIINDRNIVFNDYFNPMDNINELYALAWSKKGDYKKAFDYYSKYHKVSEEKQVRVNGRNLKQLQLTYSYEQKENELELLQKINEASLETIKKQQYLEYAFAFIIGLLSLLAFLTYQTSRQRKKLNKDLARTNSELTRLNKMKNKLFSVISHDLRTPMGNLQSILNLFQSGDLNANDVAAVASKLGQQVKSSGHVLENLLEWAKTELNESKANPTEVQLSPLVDQVIHQFESELMIKSIALVNEVPGDTIVWADQNQTEIIVRNLIANAIKFSHTESEVKVCAIQYSSTVQISVKDSGVGMTADQIKGLFQTDKLVSTPGTNKEKGSGIGLLITKELVTNNGGFIEVESVKNAGTMFTITFPSRKGE